MTDVKIKKTVAIRQISALLAQFPNIIKKPMCSPFVYSITSEVSLGLHLISLETGNVVGFYGDLLEKPGFCIEGHAFKVIRR